MISSSNSCAINRKGDPNLDIIFDDTKTFSKTNRCVKVLIAVHKQFQDCTEVVAYDEKLDLEAPHLYFHFGILVSLIDHTKLQERQTKHKEISKQKNLKCGNFEILKMAYDDLIAEYLLERLSIIEEDGCTQQFQLTFRMDADVGNNDTSPCIDSGILAKSAPCVLMPKPEKLSPVVLANRKSVTLTEIAEKQRRQQSDEKRAILSAARAVEVMVAAVELFEQALVWKQKLNGSGYSRPRIRWIRTIDKIITLLHLGRIKQQLLRCENHKEWYLKSVMGIKIQPSSNIDTSSDKSLLMGNSFGFSDSSRDGVCDSNSIRGSGNSISTHSGGVSGGGTCANNTVPGISANEKNQQLPPTQPSSGRRRHTFDSHEHCGYTTTGSNSNSAHTNNVDGKSSKSPLATSMSSEALSSLDHAKESSSIITAAATAANSQSIHHKSQPQQPPTQHQQQLHNQSADTNHLPAITVYHDSHSHNSSRISSTKLSAHRGIAATAHVHRHEQRQQHQHDHDQKQHQQFNENPSPFLHSSSAPAAIPLLFSTNTTTTTTTINTTTLSTKDGHVAGVADNPGDSSSGSRGGGGGAASTGDHDSIGEKIHSNKTESSDGTCHHSIHSSSNMTNKNDVPGNNGSNSRSCSRDSLPNLPAI